MTVTAASRTIVRRPLHHFGQAAASLPARATCCTGASCHVTARLLLIDADTALMPELLRQAFPAPTHHIQVAATGAAGVEHVRVDPPDVILLDPRLPDQSELDVYQQIRRIDARIPVIFVTMTKAADGAIEAMRQGAYDYLFKPLDAHQLRRVVGEALEVTRNHARLTHPQTSEVSETSEVSDCAIIGACPAMREVYKAIGRVAAQDVPVLITGESGTGKELVARALYQHGARATAPFLALNCAAIPENLLESELFGHEKGAFTGADRRRIGKFEQCNGGTLFLDEVGDMPPALQAKILRVLQEQAFERIGGNETVRTDVRVIAATHRDLKAAAAQGKFRPDLYYRLGVFTIHLPPLRERGDDLPLLVQHYVWRFGRELGRAVREVAPETLEDLAHYPWPGNIRELQSVLKQALLRASGAVLLPAFLPDLLGDHGATAPTEPPLREDLVAYVRRQLRPDSCDLYAQAHKQLDRFLLPLILEYTRANMQQAARMLGIARQTLRLKLRDHGLQVTRSCESKELTSLAR